MYKLQRARGARADHTDKAAVHGKWRNGLQKTARIANSTAIITKEQGIVFALPWLSVVKEESEKTHNSKVLSIRDLQRFCWPPDSIWKERAKAYCSSSAQRQKSHLSMQIFPLATEQESRQQLSHQGCKIHLLPSLHFFLLDGAHIPGHPPCPCPTCQARAGQLGPLPV